MLSEGDPPLVKRKDKTREFSCDAHIKTVASLTLLQAHRVLCVIDENGCSGLLVGSRGDFMPRKRGLGSCGSLRGRRRSEAPIPPTAIVDLDYPLSRIARVTIPPFWQNGPVQSWGHILWQIARAYKQIYKQWKKWGVWGHSLDDLYYEGLAATRDGRLNLDVGS
jgi:hypothetical protein